MYSAIGYGAVSVNQVLFKLMDYFRKEAPAPIIPTPFKGKHSGGSVRIEGQAGMLVSFAGCCSPVPGDDIVGFVTRGRGIVIHRKDCPNIMHEKSRLIEVHWDENLENREYEVKLLIKSADRSFLLSDIVTVVSQNKVGLSHVDSKVNDDKVTATTKLNVIVKNAEHLRTLIANLRKINSVNSVERVIQ